MCSRTIKLDLPPAYNAAQQKLQAQCEREEEAEKLKVKKALEKGNVEAARIHAATAIRKRNESLRYLQYQSKLDILRNQVDNAERTKTVSSAIRRASLIQIIHSIEQ